jgi:hypothetical protein
MQYIWPGLRRGERPQSKLPSHTMPSPDVTPDAPYDEQPAIGLIGMGAMGTMYAQHLSAAGWKK